MKHGSESNQVQLMRPHVPGIIAAALMILICLDLSPATATKFTYGQVRLEFAEPPEPHQTWQFYVWGLSYMDVEGGVLVLGGLPSSGTGMVEEIVLWEGDVKAKDTIFAEHSVAAPPPGNYMVYAHLRPHPQRTTNTQFSGDRLYITVRKNRVLVDRGSWTGNYYQELLEELEARGLKDATEEEIWEKAPDLGARLRDRGTTMIPAPGSKDSVAPVPDNQSRPPGRKQEGASGDPQSRALESWERHKAERAAAQEACREALRKRFEHIEFPLRGEPKVPQNDSLADNMEALAKPIVRDST
jgi:hypothetical protein